MISATTRREKYSQSDRVLYVALELSNRTWKLGMTVGFGQRARERNVPAGDLVRFVEEIQQAKKRFGLPKAAQVYSCYEAGRDGFWLQY